MIEFALSKKIGYSINYNVITDEYFLSNLLKKPHEQDEKYKVIIDGNEISYQDITQIKVNIKDFGSLYIHFNNLSEEDKNTILETFKSYSSLYTPIDKVRECLTKAKEYNLVYVILENKNNVDLVISDVLSNNAYYFLIVRPEEKKKFSLFDFFKKNKKDKKPGEKKENPFKAIGAYLKANAIDLISILAFSMLFSFLFMLSAAAFMKGDTGLGIFSVIFTTAFAGVSIYNIYVIMKRDNLYPTNMIIFSVISVIFSIVGGIISILVSKGVLKTEINDTYTLFMIISVFAYMLVNVLGYFLNKFIFLKLKRNKK